MIKKYRVTPNALADLQNIGRYTAKQWGKKQRNIYLNKLDQCFAQLAETPLIGKHRPEIAEDCFSFPQGSHVIFYLLNADSIDILGLPHKQMDIAFYFSDPTLPSY
jgi:toxin ParE1/3/4